MITSPYSSTEERDRPKVKVGGSNPSRGAIRNNMYRVADVFRRTNEKILSVVGDRMSEEDKKSLSDSLAVLAKHADETNVQVSGELESELQKIESLLV